MLFFGVYFIQKKLFQIQKNRPINHKDNSSPDILSEKIESELMQKIKEFEESKHYLDKNMSLPTLISLLNTNTTYLRSFIKKHKNTDYNNYINELRIQYIKEKLTTDKDYLNYKISYLANKCGFRSHSKFSTNFKKFTGLCPSEFITDIRNKSI
ncbi:hypothetical protein LPB303_12970 [Polaribacter atrinae]|uniref:HTH araC/xylS-type domain-containing protein n=2 Tax=Polaribacter atrinae TaxID=1333662 RepID=A0A176T9I7_9FLAO|nr:hypothetical protein LPB303_12970 [Polaribacter atrinae]